MVVPPGLMNAIVKALLSASFIDALVTALTVRKDIPTKEDLAAAVKDIATTRDLSSAVKDMASTRDIAAVKDELLARITAIETSLAAVQAGLRLLTVATVTIGLLVLVSLIALAFQESAR